MPSPAPFEFFPTFNLQWYFCAIFLKGTLPRYFLSIVANFCGTKMLLFCHARSYSVSLGRQLRQHPPSISAHKKAQLWLGFALYEAPLFGGS
jgi:hypothetical protein